MDDQINARMLDQMRNYTYDGERGPHLDELLVGDRQPEKIAVRLSAAATSPKAAGETV